MRILLTGGSGTVGHALLSKLSKQTTHQITAFDIKTKKTQRLYQSFNDRIKIVYGSLAHMKDVESVCRDVDVLIHLGAIIPPLADKNPQLAHQVNVLGTQNLIHGLKKGAPKAFLIYASSISVYGNRIQNPLIRVGDPLLPSDKDEYALTKIEAENYIRKSGLSYSIFRLTAVMGINNHKISPLMFHMPLNTVLEIITPNDAANAFLKAIDHKNDLVGKIFNLGGGEKCRIEYREFLKTSFQINGLGALDFPNKTFADKNFHCGYYADGNLLEEILHFRKDNLETYFKDIEKSIPPFKKWVTTIFRKWIKRYLLSKSDPYKAFSDEDAPLILHYFNRNHSVKSN